AGLSSGRAKAARSRTRSRARSSMRETRGPSSPRARGPDENLDLVVGGIVEIVDDHAALEARASLLFEYVEDGDVPNPDVVRLRLRGYGGKAVGDDGSLPYTQNSRPGRRQRRPRPAHAPRQRH